MMLATLPVICACDGNGTRSGGAGNTDAMLARAPDGWSAFGQAGNWRFVEDLAIGKDDADSTATFGMIRDLAVDSTGRIYVLDAMLKVVRVYDVDGRYVMTIGAEGSGPGHFRNPIGLEWLSTGELVVPDAGNGRYEVFDRNGRNVASHRRSISSTMVPWRGRFLDHGSVLDAEPRTTADGDGGISIVHMDSAGTRLATYAVPYTPSREFTVVRGQGRYSTPVPFAGSSFWEIDPSGEFFWVTSPTDYRIYTVSLAGDTIREFGMLVERERVTSAERRRAMQTVRSLPDAPSDLGDPSEIPDYKPALLAFKVDEAGYAWVYPTQPRSTMAFDVFDAQGCYLGRVQPPWVLFGSPAPLITERAAYTVKSNHSGTQYVVRYRIEGREAAGGRVPCER